jgi:farnesyl-diphosphate farnesyltransferase
MASDYEDPEPYHFPTSNTPECCWFKQQAVDGKKGLEGSATGLSFPVMGDSAKESYEFCRRILPDVSRTFAINIAVLTGELHKAILVAYLFCRIADTLEDSEFLPSHKRAEMLDDYIRIFSQRDFAISRLRSWAEPFEASDQSHPYNRLVQNSHLVLETFLTLPETSQQAISDCVVEMSKGMRSTITEPSVGGAGLKTLATISDLEEYCYYVAGTVGIMLTRLFSEYAPAMSEGAVRLAKQLEVSFGLGLQITNIVKDCREDYQRGWCYVPVELADKHQVPIAEFFAEKHHRRSLEVLQELIDKAAGHLDDALEYTLLIPRREMRMRLFCLWPLFFAIKTLVVADGNRALVTGRSPVKISRRQVYQTLAGTSISWWSNRLIRSSYHRLRSRLRAMDARASRTPE